ncbi:MAG TPA: hypothetical protein VGK29_10790 [Paludibaculum sp.]
MRCVDAALGECADGVAGGDAVGWGGFLFGTEGPGAGNDNS